MRENAIRFLNQKPSIAEVEDRVAQLHKNFEHAKSMSEQIAYQDEREILDAVLVFAKALS